MGFASEAQPQWRRKAVIRCALCIHAAHVMACLPLANPHHLSTRCSPRAHPGCPQEAQLSNKEAVDAARAELAAAQVKASAAAAALLEADKRVNELAARLKEAKATVGLWPHRLRSVCGWSAW